MLQLYKSALKAGEPLLRALLASRTRKGKEIAARLPEREGKASTPRPNGPLVWVHAASVGESQSALILLDRLRQQTPNAQILMTTGTVSSAGMMQKNLPAGAIHQFYPLDHPSWVNSFLDHWKPDLVLWMESELWPNMLLEIKSRNIPAILVNARLSDRSFNRWSLIKKSAKQVLDAFILILTQSQQEAARYRDLGAVNVTATGNLKYSAKALPFNDGDLKTLTAAVNNRPLWLYASSHKGEEAMACRIHQRLRNVLPNLLTVIVPRHPERRADIADTIKQHNLLGEFRGEKKTPPSYDSDIYVADTFGELGLFYRLAPLACIGRSFSDDGGGGHNPIEAAQLHCAVLYGPNVQFQRELYEDMSTHGAALGLKDEAELENIIRELLSDTTKRDALQQAGHSFTQTKAKVIDIVLEALGPWLDFKTEKKRAKS
jgi:3-deoxy-D-manno-octulosonic-acid transferase